MYVKKLTYLIKSVALFEFEFFSFCFLKSVQQLECLKISKNFKSQTIPCFKASKSININNFHYIYTQIKPFGFFQRQLIKAKNKSHQITPKFNHIIYTLTHVYFPLRVGAINIKKVQRVIDRVVKRKPLVHKISYKLFVSFLTSTTLKCIFIIEKTR